MYWKSLWYGSAVMVGMARIYHNVHWLSDTFLAGIIGYSAASYVVQFSDKDSNKNTVNYTISIEPVLYGSRVVIALYF